METDIQDAEISKVTELVREKHSWLSQWTYIVAPFHHLPWEIILYTSLNLPIFCMSFISESSVD